MSHRDPPVLAFKWADVASIPHPSHLRMCTLAPPTLTIRSGLEGGLRGWFPMKQEGKPWPNMEPEAGQRDPGGAASPRTLLQIRLGCPVP